MSQDENQYTPSSHESRMEGLLAGHQASTEIFKKISCCQLTEEEQALAAQEIQNGLDRLTNKVLELYPVLLSRGEAG